MRYETKEMLAALGLWTQDMIDEYGDADPWQHMDAARDVFDHALGTHGIMASFHRKRPAVKLPNSQNVITGRSWAVVLCRAAIAYRLSHVRVEQRKGLKLIA